MAKLSEKVQWEDLKQQKRWISDLLALINPSVKVLKNVATPDVRNGRVFKTGGTTTITNFTNGDVGQEIIILAEHSVTVTDGTNIFLNGSVNYAMTASDTLHLVRSDDGLWYELSRSVN